MIALIAHFTINPGKEADFEKAMGALAEQVRANEPGNKLYQLCKDGDGKYLMMELWEDADALTAHGQAAHMKAAGPSFAGIMGAAPKLVRMQTVG